MTITHVKLQHPNKYKSSFNFVRYNKESRRLKSEIIYRAYLHIDWLRTGRSGDRIPVGARFYAPVQTGPGAHPASCTMGTGSFPEVKSGRGVTLTPHPLLVPLVMKE